MQSSDKNGYSKNIKTTERKKNEKHVFSTHQERMMEERVELHSVPGVPLEEVVEEVGQGGRDT